MQNPTDPHAVLSAFLDNEPFDANELARALAEREGRELLLDLIALRQVVRDDGDVVPAMTDVHAVSRQRRVWIAAGFLAATVLFGVTAALVAPSLLKTAPRVDTATYSVADAPPTPDHVVKFEPGLDWHENNR